ncbi:hypothetical protein SLNWT_2012 [Streptomyces albus]|uniref:Uncharacterized protein n=1 Tax=Streptomyces albus (strain ATCC 21838 / DSM 41398 / FERM P-419 / JCM 4703 / NBRC 107858) TaxID=1081613 RepID=A0A0B5EJG4_STRA4|nr:hypothetical protein SLNWT_2012 [Streptomyces albus]
MQRAARQRERRRLGRHPAGSGARRVARTPRTARRHGRPRSWSFSWSRQD